MKHLISVLPILILAACSGHSGSSHSHSHDDSSHTLAPFDDCGGHVNLSVGYHMHAVTDKEGCHREKASEEGHAPQIGLAMDGYPIHQRLNAAGEVAKGFCLSVARYYSLL